MTRPDVSIIMPVHNGSPFIRKAIQSVLDQSFSSWQLIISDDQSTDDTISIAQHYCQLDRRITLVSTVARGGPARARNRAIRVATGRWIAFLDADDMWHPDKLLLTLDFARSNRIALAFTAYFRLSVNTSLDYIPVPPIITYRQLLKSNCIAMSTAMVDRKIVGNFEMNEAWRIDDYVCWLEIMKAGHPAGGLSEPLTTYRKHEQSHSSNKMLTALTVWRVFAKQQQLSWLEASWYFANYGIRGLIKHFPLRQEKRRRFSGFIKKSSL